MAVGGPERQGFWVTQLWVTQFWGLDLIIWQLRRFLLGWQGKRRRQCGSCRFDHRRPSDRRQRWGSEVLNLAVRARRHGRARDVIHRGGSGRVVAYLVGRFAVGQTLDV